MSNTVFSKNLRKLREEKQISQKSAAASLGISQALLSHYEKGIRECGLAFLTRAAEFYKVTADFLLGISRNETEQNQFQEMPSYYENKIKRKNLNTNKIKDDILQKNGKAYNINAALYKNLIINAVSYIFDDMNNIKETEQKEIPVLSGKYISLSLYHLYTLLYGDGLKNPDLSEKILIAELKYILELKKHGSNGALRDYHFENPYLTNIINNINL